ncbi:hypothetical protein LCGC14_2515500 [marine sediment metagenome]|uniref:Uncharacterized protein n=1 Tax=marine sediment metagenome TaxID=412755 RepID=A0A0F9DR85_9ZZZZ
MNKLWIEHSYDVAKRYREDSRIYDSELEGYKYLDTIGLFETSWMTFEHGPDNDDYGYP